MRCGNCGETTTPRGGVKSASRGNSVRLWPSARETLDIQFFIYTAGFEFHTTYASIAVLWCPMVSLTGRVRTRDDRDIVNLDCLEAGRIHRDLVGAKRQVLERKLTLAG